VWDILLAAFALMLIFEGVMPFAAPALWREAFRRMLSLTDGQLRFAGILAMGAGLILLALVT
jgi:uncharacterized protein YjeT (DUF2065 family)